jgi:hypothetical protein
MPAVGTVKDLDQRVSSPLRFNRAGAAAAAAFGGDHVDDTGSSPGRAIVRVPIEGMM